MEPSGMDFIAFLTHKRIDPAGFEAGLPEVYAAWARVYALIGPKSFDQQKKFLFNAYRAWFPLRH